MVAKLMNIQRMIMIMSNWLEHTTWINTNNMRYSDWYCNIWYPKMAYVPSYSPLKMVGFEKTRNVKYIIIYCKVQKIIVATHAAVLNKAHWLHWATLVLRRCQGWKQDECSNSPRIVIPQCTKLYIIYPMKICENQDPKLQNRSSRSWCHVIFSTDWALGTEAQNSCWVLGAVFQLLGLLHVVICRWGFPALKTDTRLGLLCWAYTTYMYI